MRDILDEFLELQRGTVLVNFWEDYTEACSLMDQVMQQLEALQAQKLRILRLHLSEHRTWAEHYRVRGTPSILVFHDGKLVARIRGRVDYDTILDRLRRLGLAP